MGKGSMMSNKYGSKNNRIGGRQMGGTGGNIGGSKHFQPSVINDDYTLCQYCSRRYNDEAYYKHLPGCERRFKESQARNRIVNAPKKPLPKKK